MKRPWCGSPRIYSIEYKWTNEDTPQTTQSIKHEIGSNQKPQLTHNSSDVIQGAKKIVQLEPKIAVSYNVNNDKKKELAIAAVDK